MSKINFLFSLSLSTLLDLLEILFSSALPKAFFSSEFQINCAHSLRRTHLPIGSQAVIWNYHFSVLEWKEILIFINVPRSFGSSLILNVFLSVFKLYFLFIGWNEDINHICDVSHSLKIFVNVKRKDTQIKCAFVIMAKIYLKSVYLARALLIIMLLKHDRNYDWIFLLFFFCITTETQKFLCNDSIIQNEIKNIHNFGVSCWEY